jgi:hypothetical protein
MNGYRPAAVAAGKCPGPVECALRWKVRSFKEAALRTKDWHR